jgi:hypothetical protein
VAELKQGPETTSYPVIQQGLARSFHVLQRHCHGPGKEMEIAKPIAHSILQKQGSNRSAHCSDVLDQRIRSPVRPLTLVKQCNLLSGHKEDPFGSTLRAYRTGNDERRPVGTAAARVIEGKFFKKVKNCTCNNFKIQYDQRKLIL